ncbi:MAG: hypothetical protein H6Q74_154 [Firmicutes bacterium]|nr:hypothetical protein [Bacillota bacterium]
MSVMGELGEAKKKLWSSFNLKQAGISPRLIVIGIIGVVLLIMGGVFETKSGTKPEAEVSPPAANSAPIAPKAYEDILEAKLGNLLSQVKGAGMVAVNITLENGPAEEYAQNVVKESKTVSEKDTSGGVRTTVESKESKQLLLSKDNGVDRPVVVKEVKPVIKGVLVVAEGAHDSNVKANLVRAVQSVLGIPSYKITVLPQRK